MYQMRLELGQFNLNLRPLSVTWRTPIVMCTWNVVAEQDKCSYLVVTRLREFGMTGLNDKSKQCTHLDDEMGLPNLPLIPSGFKVCRVMILLPHWFQSQREDLFFY